jgi:hypothetical protein
MWPPARVCYPRPMLEFAREQWLWLFLLVAAFFVAWWFARRYRKRRVTYGHIWERVARRLLPPGWKRVLRTVVTLLISGAMLTAIVFRAAGLQRPEAEKQPPLLVVIVLDNSPSMRAVHDGKTRAEMAQARAQEIVEALGENDRAIIAYHKEGKALLGPWLKRGEVLGRTPATEFANVDLAGLRIQIEALAAPPDVPPVPAPTRRVFWLGDTAPALPNALIETFGSETANDAIAKATYTPAEPGDPHAGVIDAATLSGRPPAIRGPGFEVEANHFELPLQGEPVEVWIRADAADPLPQDDAVSMRLNPRGLTRVTICYPAEESEPNPFLVDALREFLPGREVETRPNRGISIETDLLVCDRAIPASYEARYLLCFGMLPAAFGRTGEPVRAEPNLQLRVEPPRDLGFDAPELALLSAREAVPLAEGHSLVPLVRHIEGRALVAIKRGQPELLYSGFVPHQSTLLQDRNGLLLLLRWLIAIQASGRPLIPPFVQADAETEFKLDEAAELQVKLDRSGWLPAHGPVEFIVTTGADGRGKLGPFTIPGEYTVTRDGLEIGRFTAIWNAPPEQALRFERHERTDLEALFHPAREPDWRDHLPGLLLWLALGLMVAEWLLWLLGVTE